MKSRPFRIVLDRPSEFRLSLEPWALGFDIPSQTTVVLEILLDSESEWEVGVAEEDDGRSVIGFLFPVFRLKIGDGDWDAYDFS
jgi:hypothetical protein